MHIYNYEHALVCGVQYLHIITVNCTVPVNEQFMETRINQVSNQLTVVSTNLMRKEGGKYRGGRQEGSE